MMPSSMSSPYSNIDGRTLFRNFESETNRVTITNARTTDVFNTINSVIKKDVSKPNENKLSKYSVSPLRDITGRAYILQGSKVATLVRETKIPYPLTTLWTNQKANHIKRYSSWRMRVKKSNLPLIMEPTINETPTIKPTTVNEEKFIGSSKISHDTTSAAAGGIQVSTRRKLSLIPQVQSNGNISGPTLLKRSQSLRKSFKICNNSSCHSFNNKTDSSKTKICAATNMKSMSLNDIPKIKEKLDGHAVTTTTTSPSTAPAVDKQISPTTKIVNDFSNMSLNHNGATRESDTTSKAAITSATATTTGAQQTRPLTLTTQSSDSATQTSKGLKSPKTPNALGNHINQQHHQNRIISPQCKISPESKLTPKTPPVTPDSPPSTYLDDDLDSFFSYGTTTSGRSTMSCEHPYVARNGTTFSGRKMKYVVHCSNYAGQVGSDYLTPTQRAQRQLRRLKDLLCAARHDLEQKDSEIIRLTREVVELRLFKASLSSPEERSGSSDAVTVREAELKTSQDVSPIVDMVDDAQKTSSPRHLAPSVILHQQHLQQSSLHQQQHMMHLSSDMQSSFADSGHFEDMTSSSVHSKDSSLFTTSLHAHDRACGDMASCAANATAASAATIEQYEVQRQELIRLYEQRIEDLIRNQDATTSEIKRTNCDRIEALLQKLAECNTRYADIVPDYEHAKERIRELEKQLEELQRRLVEHEEKQKQMYLHMYQKGQEAERIARADQALELAHRAPQNKVSINELLHQLQSTQDELENIRAAECRKECGNNHALLTAKEAISLWVLGARKTIYRRLLEAQKNRTHVDPEVTLQFLKSAIYYFLTDKENSQGHLQAIESILEFSEAEKQTINKFRSAK